LAFERLPIPKVYHPFISGPDNQTVRELMDRTGVKIVVPPHSVDKDEIVVSGEKEGVLEAKRFMLAVFEDKVPPLLMICIKFAYLPTAIVTSEIELLQPSSTSA